MSDTTQPLEPSKLYWVWHHNKKKIVVSVALLLVLAAIFREEWQPVAVLVRRFAGVGILTVVWVWMTIRWGINLRWWKQAPLYLLSTALLAGLGAAYYYALPWVMYNTLTVESIDRLPETSHERIPALHAVYSLAQGTLDDSKNVTKPNFVRVRSVAGKEDFLFTMGIEPAFFAGKVRDGVTEVIATSGTSASLDLGPSSRRSVRFAVGETLWLSSNARVAVTRAFSPAMFFSYEPERPRFLIDDTGEVVQIVPLLRWRGIFFVTPEFGGVMVIRQQHKRTITRTITGYLQRVVAGEGAWIAPERIREFPYLVGQNILPEGVSNNIVRSMRFRNGVSLPLVLYHKGDTRVPELSEDMAPMPYTTFFKDANGKGGMLYHYYALEPYLSGKHGLVASVLIPADGSGRVLLYRHEEKNEGLFGVSQVAGAVRGTLRTYDWESNVPVEHRPFVRQVGKSTKLYWLTTVVTYNNDKTSYVGVPDLLITNPSNSNGRSVVVPADKPDQWEMMLPQ